MNLHIAKQGSQPNLLRLGNFFICSEKFLKKIKFLNGYIKTESIAMTYLLCLLFTFHQKLTTGKTQMFCVTNTEF